MSRRLVPEVRRRYVCCRLPFTAVRWESERRYACCRALPELPLAGSPVQPGRLPGPHRLT